MTLAKREKIECGWVEKKSAKLCKLSTAVNPFEHDVTEITFTSPSPSSNEINAQNAQAFGKSVDQFKTIELTRHNTFR